MSQSFTSIFIGVLAVASGQRAHIYGLAGEDSGINASGAGVPFNILNICFKSCERGGPARIKDSI